MQSQIQVNTTNFVSEMTSRAYEQQTRREVFTCWRRSGVCVWSWGGKKAPRRECDVIQADVPLFTVPHLALEHHLEVSGGAQLDLPHLPEVALVSRQVQQEVMAPFGFDENTEGPSAFSRHVKVETHLHK